MALLVLLSTWSIGSPSSAGSFKEQRDRVAALSVLFGFLAGARPYIPALTINIRFTESWTPSWPLPEPTPHQLTLTVLPDLSIDLEPWHAHAELCGRGSMASVWLHRIRPPCGDGKVVSLQRLLEACCNGDCNSLFAQQVWQSVCFVELAARLSTTSCSASRDAFFLEACNLMDVLIEGK